MYLSTSDVPIFPEAFSLLAYHAEVEGHLKHKFSTCGEWKISTKNVSSDHGVVVDHLVSNKDLSLKIEAKHKAVPKIKFHAEYLVKPRVLKPAVTYDVNGTKEHIISLSPLEEEALRYIWKHPKGVMSVMASSKLAGPSGTSVNGAVNCRVTEDLIAGVSFKYDCIGSGLKNYVISSKYLNRYAFSYDAAGSMAVSGVHPFGEYVNGLMRASWQRSGLSAVIGCMASFPQGGVAAKVDITTGNAAVSVHTAVGQERWLGALTLNGDLYKMLYSGVGISFTREE
eukprot:Tbor_TRINITY_DN2287_c0_g1::TRINITY_DN2287_c0_g1_i1::g.2771::m.2771